MVYVTANDSFGGEREITRFGPYIWTYVGTTTGSSLQTITHNLGTQSLQVVIYILVGGQYVVHDFYSSHSGGNPGTSHHRGYTLTMINDNQIEINRYHVEGTYESTYYVDIYEHKDKEFTN